jgi:hypothetical protein
VERREAQAAQVGRYEKAAQASYRPWPPLLFEGGKFPQEYSGDPPNQASCKRAQYDKVRSPSLPLIIPFPYW